MRTKLRAASATRDSKPMRLNATPRVSQPGAAMAAMTRPASWWGDFLSMYDWSHWVTVTPPYHEFTARELWAEFEHGYIRRLAFENRARVTWFAACELSPGGVYHIHALLGGASTLQIDIVAGAWTRGRVSAAVYNPSQRGAWYAGKTAHLEHEG